MSVPGPDGRAERPAAQRSADLERRVAPAEGQGRVEGQCRGLGRPGPGARGQVAGDTERQQDEGGCELDEAQGQTLGGGQHRKQQGDDDPDDDWLDQRAESRAGAAAPGQGDEGDGDRDVDHGEGDTRREGQPGDEGGVAVGAERGVEQQGHPGAEDDTRQHQLEDTEAHEGCNRRGPRCLPERCTGRGLFCQERARRGPSSRVMRRPLHPRGGTSGDVGALCARLRRGRGRRRGASRRRAGHPARSPCGRPRG